MGWNRSYEATGPDDIVAYILAVYPLEFPHSTCENGNPIVWGVLHDYFGGSGKHVVCFSVQRHGSKCGFVAVDETEGPPYYSCPIAILRQTEGSEASRTGHAPKWRAEVNRRARAGYRR